MFRLLDLYCCAGGAAKGYADAGFEVLGVDLQPQRHYPYAFIQADALDFLQEHGHEFDAIHASPPCQLFSSMNQIHKADHPDLITPTRQLLQQIGRPYVIENVEGAPLINPLMLCGTMFGLQTADGAQLRRHRLFELSWDALILTPPCRHNRASAIGVYGGGQPKERRKPATVGVWGHGDGSRRDGYLSYSIEDKRAAMQIDWMNRDELSQAIPPAYTAFIGRHLMQELKSRAG